MQLVMNFFMAVVLAVQRFAGTPFAIAMTQVANEMSTGIWKSDFRCGVSASNLVQAGSSHRCQSHGRSRKDE
jgi:hypothetical protein